MKIYTRNGDEGKTGLLGAIEVSKSHAAIEVCGSVDETNCHVGAAIFHWNQANESPDQIDLTAMLTQIQNELFDLGSRVAASLSANPKTQPAVLDHENIKQLENWIDLADGLLAPLTAFILPGGSAAGCHLHLARSVCRRAERRLVEMIESGTDRDLSVDLIYLNRLGDLLFQLARYANQKNGCPETRWSATR